MMSRPMLDWPGQPTWAAVLWRARQ